MTGGNRSEQQRRKSAPLDQDDGGPGRLGRASPPGARDREQGGAAPQGAVSWVRQVIEQGDYRLLDKRARELSQQLADEATRAEVRRVFGAVKRLDGLTGEPRRRELAMLRPRLAFAAARSEKLRRLREVLAEASEIAEERAEERTQRLVDLMEAVLCYALSAKSEREATPPRGPKAQPDRLVDVGRSARGPRNPPADAPDAEAQPAPSAEAQPAPDAEAQPAPSAEATPGPDHSESMKETQE